MSARRNFFDLGFPLLVGVSLAAHAGLACWSRGWTLAKGPEELPGTETHLPIVFVTEPAPEPLAEVLPPEPEPVQEPEPLLEESLPEPTPAPTPEATPLPAPAPTMPERPKTAAKSPAKANPAPSRPAAPRVIEASPLSVKNPPPHYPETARRQGWEGRALVRARIEADGRVSACSLLRSSGHSVLDRSALAAVRKWRFRPRQENGTAVACFLDVPVNFSLRR